MEPSVGQLWKSKERIFLLRIRKEDYMYILITKVISVRDEFYYKLLDEEEESKGSIKIMVQNFELASG